MYWAFRILILGGIVSGAALFSLSVGSAAIPFKKIFSIIIEGRGPVDYSILFDVRLPRILLGFAIGGSLALSGVILQSMFRNPLVEPYTLGISGGAALGVSLSIVTGLHRHAVLTLPVFGFIGALCVFMLVYTLGARKGAYKVQGLLLIGVMVSFIASSLVMLIMSISRAEDLHGIVFWIMGSLEEPNFLLVKSVFWLSLAGLAVSYLFCFDLNALTLGEEEAQHLGINIERSKRLLFILASLLAGVSVSVAGVIGFVGLVVPHFVRMFAGGDHRILLPGSFLAGGAFLIFCDTMARTIISPLELPVGVITGIAGGILFIYALTRRRVF
jgi:iron complex transport system permease protein